LTRCHKQRFITDPGALLTFSRDTILFDTTFSTVGSTTQYLKVYNSHDESILISDIKLNTGSASQYRFNVDGVDGPEVHDMEILPNDSIWVFVEVTVDPGAGNADFVVEDHLEFTTNGTLQRVLLNAWGRDAYFHGGLNDCGDPISEIISEDTVWDNSKPHVIYGIVAVDEGVTLTINPGVEVYCHSKSGIYVYKGCLEINGELNNEVTFQGDRLEAEYANLPGQWGIQLDCPVETGVGPQIASIVRGGIWIYESGCCTINYCNLRNGNVGIQVDTTAVDAAIPGSYALRISNSKILNMAGTGLLGQGATIEAKNVLVGNCGQSCAAFIYGGRYQVDNCTFANYWAGGARTAPAFALNNYYQDVNQNIQVRQLFATEFNNCILFGNSAFLTDFNESVVDIYSEGAEFQTYLFRHCLVDTDQPLTDATHYMNMTNGQGPPLCNPAGENFKFISTNSIMDGAGYAGTPFIDIAGESWFTAGVKKGCYQRVIACD
ncbi:MAG: right-handed parallel beta-helix repeat-containing protein, partial [Flavobacteriales bacterium]